MKISATTRKCVVFVLLGGILVWLLCIIFRPFQPPEPEYQGKKLTDWAADLSGEQKTPEEQKRAKNAIQHIGTNALPVALNLCRAKDSWLKRKLEKLIYGYNNGDGTPVIIWKHQVVFFNLVAITTAAGKHNEGGNIIWALGPKAAPAIPALIQLLQNQDVALAWSATCALRDIGTNAIPPLVALVTNPSPVIRFRAMRGLGLFGPEAQMAVPALVQCLGSPDPATRACAVGSLGSIKADAALVVPAIIRHLQSETNNLVMYLDYVYALGNFGTNAKSAVPVLVHILKSDPRFPSPNLLSAGSREAGVLDALKKIDPEAAEPFLEKWKASQTNAPSTNLPDLSPTPHPSLKRLKNPPNVQTNSAVPP